MNAVIHESVVLGRGSVVWQFASILEGTVIGEDCVIGSCAWIGKNCRIGNRVHIQHGVFLPNGTVVEDDAFLGPLVVLTDDKYPRSGNRAYKAQPPVVKKGASIGAGATILPGVVVGERAMVAAGSVVTRDVSDDGLVIGMPAQMKVA